MRILQIKTLAASAHPILNDDAIPAWWVILASIRLANLSFQKERMIVINLRIGPEIVGTINASIVVALRVDGQIQRMLGSHERIATTIGILLNPWQAVIE